MKKATITRLKNQLSEFLKIGRHGEPVLIFKRALPIVRLTSARSPEFGEVADEARVAKLERTGLARRGDSKALRRFLKNSPPMKIRRKVEVVKVLLDDRDE
jgi:prevent-host-death family protein